MADKPNNRDDIQHLTKSLRPYLEILLIAFNKSMHYKVADELDQKENVNSNLDAHPA